MKTITAILLCAALLLALVPGFGQNTAPDSLARRAMALPDGQEKIEVLGQLMKLYLNSDLEKARNYGHQAATLSRKTNNDLLLATAYKDLGVTHVIAANYDSSMHYYQLAKLGFEKLLRQKKPLAGEKSGVGYAGTIANIGSMFYYKSELDSAISYLLKSVELAEQFDALKVKANSLGTLSFIYMDQSKYDQAVAMQLETLRTFEQLGDQEGISRSYQGLGQIYCDYLSKCSLSLTYYRQALDIKIKMQNERGQAYVFTLMGYAHEKLKDIDSAAYYFGKSIELAEKTGDKRVLADGLSALTNVLELQKKPFPQRIEMAQRLVQVGKEIGYDQAICSAYIMLSSIYRDMGDLEKSNAYCEQVIPLATKLKHYSYLATANRHLYENYKGKDPNKALEALEAYLVNHDSVASSERFKAVADISTKYETEKKEATIALQNQRLEQERLRFWLIASLLVLALLGGALLFALTRQLRKRNQEKEFLIKEIHHRVKNNLQVLSSLLYLQSRHIQDETALDAVREGQNRVEAMGLIHQKLYMGDQLASVEMKDYLQNLGSTLLDSFGMEQRVNINYHLSPIHLDVDTAIPLGLIINELVTNSLKYAFPGGRQGTIEISLWKNDSGKLCLKVADNGVGKAGAPQLKGSTSFGTNLVEILSKKLKGKLEILAGEGYATMIQFEKFKEA
jgi:two-component sensor histidine kinase